MLPEKTKALYKDVELHAGGIYKFEVTNGHKNPQKSQNFKENIHPHFVFVLLDVRYNVAAEIVVTEKSYNQSLGKVIQV